jgi:hypothetical protein
VKIALKSLLLGCLLLSVSPVRANPWLAPGDEGLRSDLERLADAGILRGPVSTWPLSWPDIARDTLAAEDDGLDEGTAFALRRVQRLARVAESYGYSGLSTRVSAAYEPAMLRDFADTPREAGELSARASWMTAHVVLNLHGSHVIDPEDGKHWRADGSYIGMNFGNFMLSAGLMERWWGPGWDGSLILSTNARPIPSVTLERNYTDPFRSRLLSWLGPWRASIAIGEAESGGVAVPDVKFLAARLNFKPRPWLEFALTRTAQWCGADRRCDLDTFVDMVLGRDNTEPGAERGDEPGNQMAGYDMRLRSPWTQLPMSFYTQWIGEDEAGGLPSKFLGLFGLETWDSWRESSWRLRGEYAATACNFSREAPQLDCAYRNGIYPQGYSYRGRIIGHSMDKDRRMYTLAGLLITGRGDVLSLAFRRVEAIRGGAPIVGGVPAGLDNVELRLSRVSGAGEFSIGVGYQSAGASENSGSRVHGFASWQQGF